MATFEITRKSGQVYVVSVDDADLESVLSAGPWFVLPRKHTTYVWRNATRPSGKKGAELLHRFLTDPGGLVVDHVNQDGLDNRRDNLRTCTRAQNQGNTRPHKRNKSGLKGVSWDKKGCRWQAFIRANGKNLLLGYFDTPEAAHAAYCAAAQAHFGEFFRAE